MVFCGLEVGFGAFAGRFSLDGGSVPGRTAVLGFVVPSASFVVKLNRHLAT